ARALRENHNSGKCGTDTIFQEKFCTMNELLLVVVATLACAVQEENHWVAAFGIIVFGIQNPVRKGITPVDELSGLEGRRIQRTCYRGHKTTKNNQQCLLHKKGAIFFTNA